MASNSARSICGGRRQQAAVSLLVLLAASAAHAARLYIANDDMTDYAWYQSASEYDTEMPNQLDYYLGRIAATSSAPTAE